MRAPKRSRRRHDRAVKIARVKKRLAAEAKMLAALRPNNIGPAITRRLRKPHEANILADTPKRQGHPGCCTRMREIEGPRISELRKMPPGDDL